MGEERRRELRELLPELNDLPWLEFRLRPAQSPTEAASGIAFVETYRELFDRVQNASETPRKTKASAPSAPQLPGQPRMSSR